MCRCCGSSLSMRYRKTAATRSSTAAAAARAIDQRSTSAALSQRGRTTMPVDGRSGAAGTTASDGPYSNQHSRPLLQQMASRPNIQRSHPGDCDTYFGIVDFYPQYLNLLLVDGAGNLICSSTPAPADAPYAATADTLIR